MRIAIFSDVHGNWHAMNAVLADIERNGAFDHVVFGGDLVFEGGNPLECLNLLADHDIPGVVGNTDQRLWDDALLPSKPQSQAIAKAKAEWVRQQIGTFGLAYLHGLPFKLTYTPTHRTEDSLLVVHANPKNLTTHIYPFPRPAGDIPSQPDSEVEPLLVGVAEKTVAFGHYHWPNLRRVKGYTLINIASVSQPKDGDWRAKYAILTFDGGGWGVEWRRVDYDADAARQALAKSGMPGAEEALKEVVLP